MFPSPTIPQRDPYSCRVVRPKWYCSGVFALHVAVVIDRLAQQGDRRADRGFGHRVGRVPHGVAHGDAPFGGGLEVDVVHARRRHADQPQAGQPFERIAAHGHLVRDRHLRVAAAFGCLLAARGRVTRVVAQRADRREVGAAEAVFVEKYDFRFHLPCFYESERRLSARPFHAKITAFSVPCASVPPFFAVPATGGGIPGMAGPSSHLDPTRSGGGPAHGPTAAPPQIRRPELLFSAGNATFAT